MKTLIIALALLALPALAQDKHYIYSATTTALTVQRASGQGPQIQFGENGQAGAMVSCAAAQTATLSWNGTAATATAATPKLIPGTQTPSSATVYTASNVGSGTTGPAIPIPAGVAVPIDIHWVIIGNGGNFTISTDGSCTITIIWIER